MGRDILSRTRDGLTFNTARIFTEVYDDVNYRLRVTLSEDPQYTAYESKIVSPGSSADGFDVKNTGGMFSTVTSSLNATIKNNNDTLGLTIYLNTDNISPIVVKPDDDIVIKGFPITNIYIDTDPGYSGGVEIILFK